MLDSTSIRRATVGDASAIAQVHVESWRWAYRGDLPEETLDSLDVDERRQRWHGIIDDAGRSVFVATEGTGVVGFAHAAVSDDEDAPRGTAQLYAIYLLERATGSGIGRALLERVTEDMRVAGYSRATLWVLDTNERARRFYERAGWAWDGTRSAHQVQCSNMPIVRYVRDL